MANWFCGWVLAASLPVMSANFLPPAPVKSIWTIQPWPCWLSKTAEASLTSVPSTPTGPNTYFCEPSSLQATTGSLGFTPAAFSPAAARDCLVVQSRSASCFCSAAGISSAPVDGCGVSLGAGVLLPDAFGGSDGPFFSASVTARPWVVEVGVGFVPGLSPCLPSSFPSFLPSSPLPLAEGVGLGLVDGVFAPAVVVSTGRKPS